jgi:hypothetical protein
MRNFYLATAIGVGAFLAISCVSDGAFAADDAPTPVKAKPIVDVPFFMVNDNRISYSYIFQGTDATHSVRPDGTVDGKTARSVYAFTHFDAWAYGTNLINLTLLKSDHNDPAAPCSSPGVAFTGGAAVCAGESDFFGVERSTFGFNQIFNTNMFTVGPLRNVSLEVGADIGSSNTVFASAERTFVAGLEFAFDLPYKGYFNVSPMVYKEINRNGYETCGLYGSGVPGTTCLAYGNVDYQTTWTVETNYYMDLGFLPPNLQYFSISGRAGWIGPKGDANGLPGLSGVGRLSTATKTAFESEPIRLTFDASKAFMGKTYSHFVDLWVSYRYYQNRFGLDHNAMPGVCTLASTGASTNACTESSLSTGVTVKF